MERKHYLFLILAVVAGFAGGILSHQMSSLFQSSSAIAAVPGDVVRAADILLLDDQGQMSGRLASCEGAPCLMFYDDAGNVRLQMGLYSDGLPFIGLFNDRFEAKALLRLAGGNDAPVLVMKNDNQDRIILGLDLANSADPFLVYFGLDGSKHLQFGEY